MAPAAERGGRALRGRCLPYGRGHHVLAADRDRPRGRRHRRGRLAGVARWRRSARSPASRTSLDARRGGDRPVRASASRSTSSSGARASCSRALAAERPLVAVFEDVHWAEPALLDLLDHIATATTGVPLVVDLHGAPGARGAPPRLAGDRGTPPSSSSGRSSDEAVGRLVDDVLAGDAAGRRARARSPRPPRATRSSSSSSSRCSSTRERSGRRTAGGSRPPTSRPASRSRPRSTRCSPPASTSCRATSCSSPNRRR